MNLSQYDEKFRECLESGVIASCQFLIKALNSDLEVIRVARSAYILLAIGCSIHSTFSWDDIADYVAKRQHKDGGWNDVEETIWSLAILQRLSPNYDRNLKHGSEWLKSVRLPCGGWGKSDRDQPRLITSALMIELLPSVADKTTLNWLNSQWKADMSNPTKLTYKGGFFLLGNGSAKRYVNSQINKETLSYLADEQNNDGGFAPWKGHPIGSDPWTTGIVLWGLASSGELAPKTTIKRAIQWLESMQLPNGLWPYHYLDDGTAMALIGLSSALAVLRN